MLTLDEMFTCVLAKPMKLLVLANVQVHDYASVCLLLCFCVCGVASARTGKGP